MKPYWLSFYFLFLKSDIYAFKYDWSGGRESNSHESLSFASHLIKRNCRRLHCHYATSAFSLVLFYFIRVFGDSEFAFSAVSFSAFSCVPVLFFELSLIRKPFQTKNKQSVRAVLAFCRFFRSDFCSFPYFSFCRENHYYFKNKKDGYEWFYRFNPLFYFADFLSGFAISTSAVKKTGPRMSIFL